MHWLSETFVVDSRPSYPFRVGGNRYTPKIGTSASSPKRIERHVSLIFLHSIGMFKETFEPVIEVLFKAYPVIQSHSGKSLIIDEVWSIECPNHGQSTVLNASEIQKQNDKDWSSMEYATAAHVYILGKPGGHDISKRRIVLIGQSNGAEIIPFLTQMEPKLEFHSIILGVPVTSPACPERELVGQTFAALMLARRTVWADQEEARKYFERNPFTRTWPAEARELYVKYGLRERTDSKGVTLACSKEHQASIGMTIAQDDKGYDLLAALYASETPVHYLYDDDPHPLLIKFHPGMLLCKGFKPTSAHSVRGGHMFFQANPAYSAELIANALSHDQKTVTATARL
ncbi:hypothetical protein SISSUDRAFT_104350 [Sistotremastrum suecicum HHB10207 ss-3]|uniref:Uncharacterized protein n=1 Tax=Sistotremastrum suecicum HHB10207 ss-3 TaxID=1314776 RepID=A0A166B496_9AGAM|nr:hypothetical protein SISSUDRAFT_104350 [Sistotremastrum suecicum HHB10207 ss-3]